MDESDSDSDNSPANMYEEGDRFPLEGKFMNSADKAEIMAMPEIKREELLAERAQQSERDRQNRALRNLLTAREAGNKKADKKRKAAAADLDEAQRKTSRQRTKVGGGRVGEASTGIDSLKRARAEKTDRQRRRQEDKERNPGRGNTQEDYSDADADGDSEVEWDNTKQKHGATPSPDHRDALPAELSDINHILVGRQRFALVCFYPGFEEAITGCYVRISVGQDPKTKENAYKMAVIKGIFYLISTSRRKSLLLIVSKDLQKENLMRWRDQTTNLLSRHNMSVLRLAKQRENGHS
jgi:RNA polymerase-associated protein RTF1